MDSNNSAMIGGDSSQFASPSFMDAVQGGADYYDTSQEDEIVIISDNLITNKRIRSKLGVGADSMTETLTIISEGLEEWRRKGDSVLKGSCLGPFCDDLPNMASDVEEDLKSEALQLNVKLFLRDYDPDMATRSVRLLVDRLGTRCIDNLYMTVPAVGLQTIGITAHSTEISDELSSASEEEVDPSNVSGRISSDDTTVGLVNTSSWDPERIKYAGDMTVLWDALSRIEYIGALGLCDLETDIFKLVYQRAEIKPQTIQVNLKSCCVVPPELRKFALAKKINLLTHSDSPELLGDHYCLRATEGQIGGEKWFPQWIIRFQLFKKLRGMLQDKRYLISLRRRKVV